MQTFAKPVLSLNEYITADELTTIDRRWYKSFFSNTKLRDEFELGNVQNIVSFRICIALSFVMMIYIASLYFTIQENTLTSVRSLAIIIYAAVYLTLSIIFFCTYHKRKTSYVLKYCLYFLFYNFYLASIVLFVQEISIVRSFYVGGIILAISYMVFIPNSISIILVSVIGLLVTLCYKSFTRSEFSLMWFFYVPEAITALVLFVLLKIKSDFDFGEQRTFLKMKALEVMHNYYKNFLDKANFEIVTLVDGQPIESNTQFDYIVAARSNLNVNDIHNVDKLGYLNSLKKYNPACSSSIGGSLHKDSNLSFDLNEKIESIRFKNESSWEDIGHFSDFDQGKLRILSLQIRNFKMVNGPCLLDIIIKDVSLSNLMEREAAECRLKHKVFSKMAHEFKTPFLIIGNELEALSSCSPIEITNVQPKLKLYSNLFNYCLFLIEDLIQYSSDFQSMYISLENRVDIKSIGTFAFNVLNSYKEFYPNRKAIQSEFIYDDTISTHMVQSDSQRLKQILLNFVSNAVKFTKQGQIIIRACLIDKYSIEISVEDTGIGMTPEQISQANNASNVYSPIKMNIDREYNQLGSGIGISICKNIVKNLPHHKIVISSMNFKGTKASIVISGHYDSCNNDIETCENFEQLQLVSEESSITKYQKYSNMNLCYLHSFDNNYSRYSCCSMSNVIDKNNTISTFGFTLGEEPSVGSEAPKILIIDDSIILRKSIIRIFKAIPCYESYIFIEGCDGIELLNYCLLDLKSRDSIKMIITDENMEYMCGSESISFLKRLKELGKFNNKCPIISLTAFCDETTVELLYLSGAQKVVIKPFTKSTAISLYENYLK